MSLKARVRRFLSPRLVERLDHLTFRARRARIRATRRGFGVLGFNVVKRRDVYSTLPVLEELEASQERWNRPSSLTGIDLDVEAMQRRLEALAEQWEEDRTAHAGDHRANEQAGFGPGYPAFDARTLWYFLREHKPARYLEIGSGLSTHYASLAAQRNAAEGMPMQITCIEPYPFDALRTVPGIDLVVGVAQDQPLERFEALGAGDVLFIDSSHALRIDSDVAYLYLEVLPRLQPGVLVHIHDVPFPYNVPYPARTWMFGERWPVYWNEAMVVQTFLAFNRAFEVLLSTPLLRHEDERFLTKLFDDYVPVDDDPNPPSSLWLQRVA